MNIGALGSKKFNRLLATLGIGPSIGDIRYSRLNESQFQQLNGDSWVLYDGRNIAGTDLAQLLSITNLEDARGLFLRGKNNGRSDGNQNPDGELALGAYQHHQVQSHSHSYSRFNKLSVQSDDTGTGRDMGTIGNSTTGSTGGNETRPKNLTVNIFIKVNW